MLPAWDGIGGHNTSVDCHANFPEADAGWVPLVVTVHCMVSWEAHECVQSPQSPRPITGSLQTSQPSHQPHCLLWLCWSQGKVEHRPLFLDTQLTALTITTGYICNNSCDVITGYSELSFISLCLLMSSVIGAGRRRSSPLGRLNRTDRQPGPSTGQPRPGPPLPQVQSPDQDHPVIILRRCLVWLLGHRWIMVWNV